MNTKFDISIFYLTFVIDFYNLLIMSVAQKIEKQLQNIPEGEVFRYENLEIAPNENSAAYKAVERFIATGQIQRTGKGLFYKPRQTVFGALKPNDNELLKPYLFKNKQRIAYVTGIRLYNQMGLTTQVPFYITIATTKRRNSLAVGKIVIKPTKSYAAITDKNYLLLGILDAIKDFKTIPDLDEKNGLLLLSNKIKELDPEQTQELIVCALQYPPRVRALVGAIAENATKTTNFEPLRESLNPLTSYKWDISNTLLPTASKWQIK
jgi:hypothetical protein